jgi:hypothetical protein
MLNLPELATQWAVSFAIGLAFLVFIVKLFVHRRLNVYSFVSGIAELPSDIAAACLSLAAAYFWLNTANAKLGSIAFIFLAISFVLTTAAYRYVDDKKEEFYQTPFRISACIALSYLTLYILSIQIIGQLYIGNPQ